MSYTMVIITWGGGARQFDFLTRLRSCGYPHPPSPEIRGEPKKEEPDINPTLLRGVF